MNDKIRDYVCTPDEYSVLNANRFKRVPNNGGDVRIIPIGADIPVMPTGPAKYRTQLEFLDEGDESSDLAEPEACEIVRRLVKPK